MQRPFNDAYEPLGDLTIEMDHGAEVTGYRRELDLDRRLCRVTYEAKGTRYLRETFVSHPAQMVVARLSAVGGAGLNAVVGLGSPLQARSTAPDERTIHLTCKAPSYSVPNYLADDDPNPLQQRSWERYRIDLRDPRGLARA